MKPTTKIKYAKPVLRQKLMPENQDLIVEEHDIQTQLKDSVKNKKTRPDKTVEIFETGYCQFLSVKMRLNRFLKDNSIIEPITRKVSEMNHMTFLSYHLLNFHFVRLLSETTPVHLPKTLTQNEINRLFLAVSKCGGVLTPSEEFGPEWSTSIDEFRKILDAASAPNSYPFPNRDYSSTIVSNASKQMLTSVMNHFNLNFNRRLAKYLRYSHQENDRAKAYYWADRILNERQINPAYPSKFDGNETTEKIIRETRQELKIVNDKEVKIFENLDVFLPYCHKILLFFKGEERKLFSLMPQKGELIPNYIKICTSSLRDLLDPDERDNRDKFLAEARKNWIKIVNLNLVETKNFIFGNTILTNGYDVSILLKKQITPFPPGYDVTWSKEQKVIWIKKFREQEQLRKKAAPKVRAPAPGQLAREYLHGLNWTDYDAKVAVDLGRRRFFMAVTGMDRNAKIIQCSGKEWCHRTGRQKRLNAINKRKDASQLIRDWAKFSFKTGLISEYRAALAQIVPKITEILKFYSASFYRKNQFTKYTKTQKAFKTVTDRLKVGENTLVGIGDGSINTNGACKGNKLPVKRLKQELNRKRGVTAADVNECCSTKKCSVCHKDTGPSVKQYIKVEQLDGSEKTVKAAIYGLRRCLNNECRITWDRDVNAPRNIFTAMESEIKTKCHPDYLTRSKPTKKLISPQPKPKPGGVQLSLNSPIQPLSL